MSDPFPTTRWSLVLAAREKDTPRAREALENLCRDYWIPLYAFVRRRGYGVDDALDLTQSYFVRIFEGRYIDIVDPQAGRFRAFLLHKLKHFLANEHERERAKKRGGGLKALPFSIDGAERHYDSALADRHSPDKEYDRRWAQTVVDRAVERLEQDAQARGRVEEFRRLKGYLTGESSGIPYSKAAAELKVSESTIKSAVHRLRKRSGEMMREEISQTVRDPADVEDEMRYLLTALV